MANEERSEHAEQPNGETAEATGNDAVEAAAEPEGAAPAADDPAARIAELEAELEQANSRAEENWNQFLRSRAELENVRRRLERDVEQARKYGLEKLAAELLPVKDSLEMGLQAASEGKGDFQRLVEGTELTLKMLIQVFERFNIKEMDPLGEKFDADKHEAMATQPSDKHMPNTVIDVMQKGYLLNERLLRPAMVIVSRRSDGNGDNGDEGSKA